MSNITGLVKHEHIEQLFKLGSMDPKLPDLMTTEINSLMHKWNNKQSELYNDQKVILLKEDGDHAGVSATFTAETNDKITDLKIGETVTVKGVIRSGAAFDKDLGFYENVILEKSDLVAQK